MEFKWSFVGVFPTCLSERRCFQRFPVFIITIIIVSTIIVIVIYIYILLLLVLIDLFVSRDFSFLLTCFQLRSIPFGHSHACQPFSDFMLTELPRSRRNSGFSEAGDAVAKSEARAHDIEGEEDTR